jgi:dUTP pyrophosphatase
MEDMSKPEDERQPRADVNDRDEAKTHRRTGASAALGAAYGSQPDASALRQNESLYERMAETQRVRNAPHIPVTVAVLHPNAVQPSRGTGDSAGYDLSAIEDMTIPPRSTYLLPLGFKTEIHPDYHGRIESRSGMAVKGCVVLTGVIDADYRGEWHVILRNVTDEPVDIAIGQRVAQVVFRPTVTVAWSVGDVSESARGGGGFGSTGH